MRQYARIDADLGPADEAYDRMLADARRVVADRDRRQPASTGGADRRAAMVALRADIDAVVAGGNASVEEVRALAARALSLGVPVETLTDIRLLAAEYPGQGSR